MTIESSTQEDKRVGEWGGGVWLQRKKLLLKWRKPAVISAADVPSSGCDAKCPFAHPSQLGRDRRLVLVTMLSLFFIESRYWPLQSLLKSPLTPGKVLGECAAPKRLHISSQ